MSYGRKYYTRFQDLRRSVIYRAELLKKDYTSTSSELTAAGNPCDYKSIKLGKGDNPIVIGSELVLNLVIPSSNVAIVNELMAYDYREWLLRLYICDPSGDTIDGGDLEWVGYLQPENIKRDVSREQLVVSLSATDGLKDLQEAAFIDSSGWVYGNQLMSGTEIIKEALKKTGIELNMVIKTNISETTQSTTELNLNYSFFNTYRFTGEGRGRRAAGYENIDSCLEVLSKILRLFNARLRQVGGRYRIFSLHEQNTFEFRVNWDTLNTTRYAAVDIVDVSDYKFRPEPELSMLSPVKRVDVIHRNRNLGTSPIAADLSAWATTWNITYGEYTIDGKTLILDINQTNTGDDKVVELAADFDVSVDTDDPYYLRISFGHWLHEVSDISPYFQIGIKKGGTWAYSAKKFLTLGTGTFTSDNSSLYALPETIGTHSMNIRILFGYEFNEIPAPSTWNAQWSVNGVDVKKVVVIEGEEGEVAEDITFDTVWRFENDLPAKVNKEHEFIFGDSSQIGDLGAIYVGADADNAVNSTEWKRYGITEAKPLMEIIGRLAVNNRQVYKEFFNSAQFLDPDNNIRPHSIIKLSYSGTDKYYLITNFSKNLRNNVISLKLEQILYDEASLKFAPMPLTMSSVDGHTRTADSLVLEGGVTSTERSNWNDAYDYSQVGHVETETDPVFNAHVASDITSTNISNWNAAHSERGSQIAGTGLTWSEGNLSVTNTAASITSTDINNWNEAHGWGDHSEAGYATAEDIPGSGDVFYYEPTDSYFLDIFDSNSPSSLLFSVDISHTHGYDDLPISSVDVGNWNDAHTHVSSDGSDHTYINQNVTTSASPTFGGLTVNGDITANNLTDDRLRKITAGTLDPSGGSHGDVYMQYEE